MHQTKLEIGSTRKQFPILFSAASILTLALLILGNAKAEAATSTLPLATTSATTQSAKIGKLTVSPAPGTPDAMPQTQLSFLNAKSGDIKKLRVVGSTTGRHSGRFKSYKSAAGQSFLPNNPFANGETVRVSFSLSNKIRRYQFTVGTPHPAPPALPLPAAQNVNSNNYFTTQMFPTKLTVNAKDSKLMAPGYNFAAPFTIGANAMYGQIGTMIFDGNGSPVWFRPSSPNTIDVDFKPQEYKNKPVLTWWEGDFLGGFGFGDILIYDNSYRKIATVKAGNGMEADLHDFRITKRNTGLVVIYQPITFDLTPYGGQPNAGMWDSVVQEIDIPTGLVMYEWHSLGNIELDEAAVKVQPGPALYDPYHINSAQAPDDSTIAISNRNTKAVYNIDKATGQIRWRLGGNKSSFEMGAGTKFAWQHDFEIHANNTVTLFDNEASPAEATQSRAVVIKLDTKAHTASLVKEFTHAPPLLSASQGNAQSLPNGSFLVGWGQQPYLTEFDSNGATVFDAKYFGAVESYRHFRSPWIGKPTTSPVLVTKVDPTGQRYVYVSWNGATGVSKWRLRAGTSANSLKTVTTVKRTGFETAIPTSNAGPYFQVQPISYKGNVMRPSKVLKAN